MSLNPSAKSRAWRRPGLRASLAGSIITLLGLVPADPGGAAVRGIGGRITGTTGTAAEGVVVDLFAANADGSRGRFLADTRTTANGAWWFDRGDGCYVVTMIAPSGRTFINGSRWHQRSVCVTGGRSPAGIDGTLSDQSPLAPPPAAPPHQPAPPTPPNPSCTAGQPIWNLVLDEHFNTDIGAVDRSWHRYNSTGNAGYGLRRPHAVSVWGGSLNIRAAMENGMLVSGGLSHNVRQTYGRYEFRVRTDKDLSEATSGVVLTWPASNVHPRDGENNIYETLARPGDRHEFYSFIHEPYGTVHDQDYTVHKADASQWHTMAMEWMPDKLVLYRNGEAVKTIIENSDDLIPDNPHFMAIQLDAWKHTLPSPVTMQVDYVKVWSYGGTRTC